MGRPTYTGILSLYLNFCPPLQRWGSMMMYRGIECPCLHVKNFVVTFSGKKIGKCTKWNELTVKFSALDYAEIARQVAESSDDEETN